MNFKGLVRSFYTKIVIGTLIIVCTFFLGYHVGLNSDDEKISALRIKGDYHYINPLILSDISGGKDSVEFSSLKNKIISVINGNNNQVKVSHVSVYFRDMNGGRWLGIGENENYSPASMLKVPLMIAYYKYAEIKPEILSAKITYKGDFDDNKYESIKPLNVIEAGKSYTVDELIHYMIAYSDNNATRLLHDNMDPHYLLEAYSDLDIDLPTSGNIVDFMSVKEYSSFYRILYNATYLNREMSEKALGELAAPDFPQGLQSGVPATIQIAQKFGEREVQDPITGLVTERQLHDCGIIYYPNSPYLLCVMTKGSDLTVLTSMISKISKEIYTDVSKGILNQ